LVNFKNCTGLCWKVEMSNTKIFIYVSWWLGLYSNRIPP
jgi:hypothetical protein